MEQTSGGPSQYQNLPVYFGNVCLRFLPVFDIVVHRYLEIPPVIKSLEILLEHLGCLYKFHGMFLIKSIRSNKMERSFFFLLYNICVSVCIFLKQVTILLQESHVTSYNLIIGKNLIFFYLKFIKLIP